MYTKREMGEKLKSLLYPKQTNDSKMTLQEAMQAVSEARDEVCKLAILRGKAETNVIAGNWLSSFEGIPVLKQEDCNKYYTILPVGVISLPNDLGVYHVHFDNNPEELFIPVTPGMTSMYRSSIAKYLEGEYGYYLKEDKIHYTQKMKEGAKVSMNLIAQSTDLGEYDYFPIDGATVNAVLQRAMEIQGTPKQVAEDLIRNNVSE